MTTFIKIWCFCIFVLLCQHDYGSYLYPVACVKREDTDYLYVLYQKSLSHLELFLWNPVTKRVSKALPSFFTPAGIRVLPDYSGFSFTDKGRIKLKTFSRRSPKSIDFYEPIFGIEMIHWIDATTFYFSARADDHYALFHANVQAAVHRLCASKTADCLYPQKIDDILFYVEREKQTSGTYRYTIVQTGYPTIVDSAFNSFNNTDHFEERVAQLLRQKEEGISYRDVVIDNQRMSIYYSEEPLIFLHMANDVEGFFVKYPTIRNGDLFAASYYHLQKSNSGWTGTLLFDFTIPYALLEGEYRLYESILPFLPRHYGDLIYYCSISEHNTTRIFCYNLQQDLNTALTEAPYDSHYFSPLKLHNKLFYGFSFPENSLPDLLYLLFVDVKGGNLCLELKYISI